MFEINDIDTNELDNKPYDPLESIFNDFMYREKEIIKDYWTGDKYKVIFRPNSDRNQMNDNSTIFYYAEENINVGSLLVISGEYYLTLNKQAVENRIYKQSDLVKCNTIFNGFSGGKEIVIPVHVMGLTSPYGNNGNTISVMSGNIEIITQYCELSQSIKENASFYAIGGKWSVTRVACDNSDILHIYAKSEAFSKEPTYTLNINLQEAYKVGTTDVLTAVAKRNESSETNIVTNATIIWESSDNNIVFFTKDSDGKTDGTATFNNVGEAEIVAIWKEHNIAEVGYVNVTSGVAKKCEITYSGLNVIKVGGSAKTFVAWFYDENNQVDTSVVPVWSLELLAPTQQGKVTIVSQTGNDVRIQCGSGDNNIGTTFNLCLTDTNGEYNYKLEIEIDSLF